MGSLHILGVLVCLYIHALAAAITPPDANTLIAAPGPGHTVTLSETFSNPLTLDNNNTTLPPTYPIWVYPPGKDLRLKFEHFTTITAAQQGFARDVIEEVIQVSLRHNKYETLKADDTYIWGTATTIEVGVYVVQGVRGGYITWGDVTDVANAMRDFLMKHPMWDFWVVVYTGWEPVVKKGDFVLLSGLEMKIS
jgi:hypothetical protein